MYLPNKKELPGPNSRVVNREEMSYEELKEWLRLNDPEEFGRIFIKPSNDNYHPDSDIENEKELEAAQILDRKVKIVYRHQRTN